MAKTRMLVFWSMVGLAAFIIARSACAAGLTHRYNFSSTNDLVGTANLTLSGDALLASGQLALNLDGDPGTPRNGVANMLANGASGININTYSGVTIELFATPDATLDDSFSTVVGFGDVY